LSKNAIRVMVLAPGFAVAERTVEVGAATARLDVELKPQSWKEIQAQLEDGAGRPVAGVEVSCSVGGVTYSRFKSDGDGRFRFSMAPAIWITLAAEPEDARPVEAPIAVTKDGPKTITLPVLPPCRGRVVDPEGRPVPDIAVGRWVTFDAQGAGEMLPFFGDATAVTDRGGNFVIAPKLMVHGYTTRPGPHRHEGLCFADSRFRRIGFRSFEPKQAAQPMEVTLKPARQVRIPLKLGSIASTPGTKLGLFSQVITTSGQALISVPLALTIIVVSVALPLLVVQLEGSFHDETSKQSLDSRVHLDRAAGRHCHHRGPDRIAPARRAGGA
jgi:hypothetical protein